MGSTQFGNFHVRSAYQIRPRSSLISKLSFWVSTNVAILVELLPRLYTSSLQCSYPSKRYQSLLPLNILEPHVDTLQSNKRNSSSLYHITINRGLTMQMTLSAY